MKGTLRVGAVLVTVVGLVLAGVAPAVGGENSTAVASSADEHAPPDPASDRLGWEDGYWYNESVDVNQSDGVSRAEFNATVSRAMARVERIRRLEFKQRPDVRFLTEAEYQEIREETRARQVNVTTADRTHQNVKFEALFLVGENRDYFAEQAANAQTNVPLAFTVTGESPVLKERGLSVGDVAIIRSEGEIPRIEETTLAHELVHVLQTQYYNVTTPTSRRTEDAALAFDGVVEGDATYLDGRYGSRCEATWDCLSTPDGPPPNVANLGLVMYGQTVYAEGPGLVESVESQDGWTGVGQLYETPPQTTEQLIHPETYPDDAGRELQVEDRSGDAWRVLDLEDGIDYATFGEAGIFIMLYYPSYQSRSEVVMRPGYPFENTGPGFYNLDHPASAGWDGDKLYPYVSDAAGENETGYVWKTTWDSETDAREFAVAYRQVLEHRGARQAQGADNAYVIRDSPGSAEFEDAFAVTVEGDTVTIVNAPTLDDLNGVRSGVVPADVRTPSPTPTDTPFGGSSPSASETETPAGTPASPTASSGQPGFGALTALLALIAMAVAARRLG
jgi:hypothetical protein